MRKEVWGLLSNISPSDISSDPPLDIVRILDSSVVHLPRYATTLVVRQKGTGVIKSRLRLRDDKISIARRSFTSAPTADRFSVRMLLSRAANFSLAIGSCDATQAFLQSDWLKPSEQYLALPPPCIVLSGPQWDGEILPHPPEGFTYPTHASHCREPLYGSRCAPLRWFFAIAAIFKQWNWRCHKSDMCVFSRRSDSGRIIALAYLHMGDVLVAAVPSGIQRFVKMMNKSVKHGGFNLVEKNILSCFPGCEFPDLKKRGSRLDT